MDCDTSRIFPIFGDTDSSMRARASSPAALTIGKTFRLLRCSCASACSALASCAASTSLRTVSHQRAQVLQRPALQTRCHSNAKISMLMPERINTRSTILYDFGLKCPLFRVMTKVAVQLRQFKTLLLFSTTAIQNRALILTFTSTGVQCHNEGWVRLRHI